MPANLNAEVELSGASSHSGKDEFDVVAFSVDKADVVGEERSSILSRLRGATDEWVDEAGPDAEGVPGVEADLEAVVLGVDELIVVACRRGEDEEATGAAGVDEAGQELAAVGAELHAGEAGVVQEASRILAGVPLEGHGELRSRTVGGIQTVLILGIRDAIVVVVGVVEVRDAIAVEIRRD